jgi:hypothetical protein
MSDWDQIDQSDNTHTNKSKPKRRKVTHGKKQKTMPKLYLFIYLLYHFIFSLCLLSKITYDL